MPGESSQEHHQTLVTLFLQAAHLMIDELVYRMAVAGYRDIRATDSRVFENLDRDGTRLTDLATRARMTRQSMSELIAGLEARGYVARRPDPSDRRARLVCLTPRGREVMREALGQLADIESHWLDQLARGDRDIRTPLQHAIEVENQAPGEDGRSGEPHPIS